MTGIKRYLLVAIILLVAVILLANKLVVWGAAFIAAGLIVLGIQQLIQLNVKVSKFEDNISGLEEKNQGLSEDEQKLMEENAFLKRGISR
jgi:predicted ATP-grasp superfamily ATP-dependent carboligase